MGGDAADVGFAGRAEIRARVQRSLVPVERQQWSRWVEPEELFDSTLEEVRTVAGHLPLLITEVACAEAAGSKPGWIGTLLSYLVAQPDVEGLIWFDHDKETDWRITSSAASAAAMAAALARGASRRSTREVLR